MPHFLSSRVLGLKLTLNAIGACVRDGADIISMETLVCPTQTGDLSARRAFRAQRRTLRLRKKRREWISEQLQAVGVSAAEPEVSPSPLDWRLAAARGDRLSSGRLHAAIMNLFSKRGGPVEVPWKNGAMSDEAKAEKEAANAVFAEMKLLGVSLPCELLEIRRREAGISPTAPWKQGTRWPAELIEREFRAICAAQAKHFPKLAEKCDWILFGDTREVKAGDKSWHVWTNRTERDPKTGAVRKPYENLGALSLRWPKFDNRAPELCSIEPYDAEGRPQHTVKRNKAAYAKTQWEIALLNFRVRSATTGRILDPREQFPRFIDEVKAVFKAKGKVTEKALRKVAADYADVLELIEGHTELTPQTGDGRARYSSKGLEILRDSIGENNAMPHILPCLRRQGESLEAATSRYLSGVRQPLVKHRLTLFAGMLDRLTAGAKPDFVVIEADRELGMSEDKRNEVKREQKGARVDRQTMRDEIGDESASSLKKWRLAKEAGYECVFTGARIGVENLPAYEIVHIVPRSRVVCDEWRNLILCPVELMRELRGKTPHEAFSHTQEWKRMLARMDSGFRKKALQKYTLFVAPDAETLLEREGFEAKNAYLARLIRGFVLLRLGWLGDDGRDNAPAGDRFLVTSRFNTSRLRASWGLNGIFHPAPAKDAPSEVRARHAAAIAGDFRYIALDAAVASATHPAAARANKDVMVFDGMTGLWSVDERTQRSIAGNPLGFTREKLLQAAKGIHIGHHSSKSLDKKAYGTTFYSRREIADEKGKPAVAFVTRAAITSLSEKNLGEVFPSWLGKRLVEAWANWRREVGEKEADALVKKARGCIPAQFAQTLCFSNLQRIEAKRLPYSRPDRILIPIRDVRLVAKESDSSVVRGPKGTPNAYVARDSYTAFRIYHSADGTKLVPVPVAYRKDDVIAPKVPVVGCPILTVRKGDVFDIPTANPSGKWRVAATGTLQVKLFPVHMAGDAETMAASGISKSGWQPAWGSFLDAIGLKPAKC